MSKNSMVTTLLVMLVIIILLLGYVVKVTVTSVAEDVADGTGKVYVSIVYSGGEVVFLEKSKDAYPLNYVGYGIPQGNNVGYGGVELVRRRYKEGDPELELMVDYDATLEIISYTEKLETYLKMIDKRGK